ncbi:MAG: sugar transporter [Chitinophagaceae bacterium]|nr:sugar transporter [Chitinophagaceae bacterium]
MKKLFFTLLTLFIFSVSFGQILNPVKFNYKAVKKTSNQYEIHIKASLEPKWHIYSIKNPEGGAQATEIKFKSVNSLGTIKEAGKMKTGFNKEFGVNEKYFESAVDFVQLVKITPGTKKVSGSIEYMVCNDKQCLPPKEIAFEISL